LPGVEKEAHHMANSKIIELRASNFKRLAAVTIRPDGSLVEITGKNAQGKTSCLDAIWVALKGRSVAPPEPIRAGEEKCVLRLDLGDLHVTRTFTRAEDGKDYTQQVKVVDGDGNAVKRPQDVLDSLVAEIAFDPMDFLDMRPKEQFALLARFVPGFDFDEFTAAQKADYEARTTVNRKLKEYEAITASIKLPEGKAPAAVDVSAVSKQIEDAYAQNSESEKRRVRRESIQRQADDALDEAESLRAKAAALEAKAAEWAKQLADAERLPALIDVAPLRERIAAAEEIQRVRRMFEAHQNGQDLIDQHTAEATRLTKAMEARETQRKQAIGKAQFPVEGLSFGEDHIRLGDAPFEQASRAEQTRVAVAIAGALNPELKIAFVRDGSLLDEDARLALATYAETHGLQVWIETVQKGEPTGFLIENGRNA
jgi:DNA repair exonuclease SbcCD ATPase subunit